MESKLSKYKEKRHFDKTPEPEGRERSVEKRQIFVIQKHDASNLHYDFRIEIDGVLKSWVIPKGPSLDPFIKRLAILTEDHPLEYADFEGIIPKDQYGGGIVIIWDKGNYENIKKDNFSITKSFERGRIEINLKGKKLKGGFALIRIKGENGKQWLLIKMNDNQADRENDILKQEKSIISNKTIEQISKEKN